MGRSVRLSTTTSGSVGVPVTFIAIIPTNNKLLVVDPVAAGPESRVMIERWGSLHAVRTALGFAASLAFLWASLS